MQLLLAELHFLLAVCAQNVTDKVVMAIGYSRLTTMSTFLAFWCHSEKWVKK